MKKSQTIAPCLWFENQAEEAARFYTSIFRNSKIGTISRYGEAGQEIHRQAPGGISWQVVPNALIRMIIDPDPTRSQGTMKAMLQMKKIDIDKLEEAYAG